MDHELYSRCYRSLCRLPLKDHGCSAPARIVPESGRYQSLTRTTYPGASGEFTSIRGRRFPRCPSCDGISFTLVFSDESHHRNRSQQLSENRRRHRRQATDKAKAPFEALDAKPCNGKGNESLRPGPEVATNAPLVASRIIVQDSAVRLRPLRAGLFLSAFNAGSRPKLR
jgi:hypothetical protein